MSRLMFIWSSSLLMLACGEPTQAETALAGQDTALAAPVLDHGPLAFAQPLPLTLGRRSSQHLFHFDLSAPAQVALRTLQDATGEIDTLITLEHAGSGRVLARDDDGGDGRFSRLVRRLPAGAYRLRVSGSRHNHPGSFLLEASCTGQGCPVAEPVCLFGDTFYALRTEGRMEVLEERWVRAPQELASALEAQQLVIAVQQSSHSDVTTAAQALARVDQNEARRMRLRAPHDAREYDVFEYGAGDNSYGAIFRADSSTLAASIQDGDLLGCTER